MTSTITGRLSFKFYLTNNDNTVKEIRRFDSKVDVVDFQYVCEVIRYFFPELRDEDFTISWLDKDQDKIVIRSNHELKIAIKSMFEDCKLYVSLCPENQEKPTCNNKEEILYCGAICDGCDNPIKGFRYSCIECIDYDLCSQCEALKLHANHCMIRFPQQMQLSIYQCFLQETRKFPFIQQLLLKFGNMNLQVDNVGCCQRPPKQKDGKVDSTRSSAPLGCVIDSFLSNILNTCETEKKEKDKENVTADKSAKLPEEEIERTVDAVEKLLPNDITSVVSSLDTTVKKTEETEEWTVIEKNDTLDSGSVSSSVSSSLNNNFEKEVSALASVASSPSKDNPSNQMINPQVSEKLVSEIINERYHRNPKIQSALATMIEMGFTSNLEYIADLLESEDGVINKVLHLLMDK
ncbi:sequestosome-1 [Colletes gigas]|uniref:sequestosome-1 n=1 Tax=Colletes gigas TaxID=935657 RepID=UPI001C9B41B8|nr:sequestosome-1 [Colletes gigas]